jgi:hypothetical protein
MKLTRKIAGISATIATVGLLAPIVASAATIVDTELLLSIDVSGSVNNNEFILQRDGYAAAFENSSVIDAIANQPNGIAVALSYWSSNDTALEIDWTLLTTESDVLNFADIIRNSPRPFSGATNIPSAINFGVSSILGNDFDGTNLVIDVSGDGTSTSFLTQAARDNAVANNVTVNGLAIGGQFIEDFYRDNVIGGQGSFVLGVSEFSDIANAATQKIAREIVNPNPNPNPTQTPEPTTILGLVAFGAFGAVASRKRNQV